MLKKKTDAARDLIDGEAKKLLTQWDDMKEAYKKDELVYTVRGKEIRVPLYTESLSHQKIPKICLPKFKDPGEIYRWLRRENLPGYFPYTAGVFPLKRWGKTLRECLPEKETRPEPTPVFVCFPATTMQKGCLRHLIR